MTQERHVVFGSGPLGIATAEALLRRNHQVTLVSRSGRAVPLTGATVSRADLYNQASVQQISAGATAVYQCAQPAYTEWLTKFEPLQNAIIAGVAASGAKLIVAENLYMYGEVTGLIHEALPYNAHTKKGRVRARMAEQVAEVYRSGKLRTASARGSDFFGPGVLGSTLGERVFLPALQGKAAQMTGRVDLPHSYTSIGDFGETLAILGEHESALGQHWHVPTAPALTQREIGALIAAALGQPVKIGAVNRLMMTLAGLFISEARETVEMMYEFERPFVVDSRHFEQTFGLMPTPLDQAIQRTVDWYRTLQAAQPAVA